jgi:hypothetical protein
MTASLEVVRTKTTRKTDFRSNRNFESRSGRRSGYTVYPTIRHHCNTDVDIEHWH